MCLNGLHFMMLKPFSLEYSWLKLGSTSLVCKLKSTKITRKNLAKMYGILHNEGSCNFGNIKHTSTCPNYTLKRTHMKIYPEKFHKYSKLTGQGYFSQHLKITKIFLYYAEYIKHRNTLSSLASHIEAGLLFVNEAALKPVLEMVCCKINITRPCVAGLFYKHLHKYLISSFIK